MEKFGEICVKRRLTDFIFGPPMQIVMLEKVVPRHHPVDPETAICQILRRISEMSQLPVKHGRHFTPMHQQIVQPGIPVDEAWRRK